ncbi:MAG: DUF2911 domain-containing protein [Gemmatimonadota bacterium]
MSRARIAVLSAMALGAVATVAVTGTSLVSPSLWLGPCLRDFTSPISYQERASPLATLRAPVGRGEILLCYGRPSMRQRQIFGGLVPFDSLWRTGANEPTRLSTNRPIILAGIPLAPGRYSIYSIPTPDKWAVFVSRSTQHWGNDISPAVRGKEVGRADIPTASLTAPVETLTVHAQQSGDSLLVAIDWETTRVVLPIKAVP